jgi:hypothetical protein
MESLDNKNSFTGFFKHVFNFDQDSKSDMLNIVQYTLLAMLPVIGINKAMQKYVPEASEDKGSVELSLEVILQSLIMFLGIYFVHRMIEYIPTYSGVAYPEFKVVYVILAVLMIVLSLQTKLGEKVNILSIRLVDAYNGTDSFAKKKKAGKEGAKGNMRISQPISQGGQMPPNPQQVLSPNQAAMQQSLEGSTPITNIPTTPQIPNYTNMYQDTPNPMINANVPGSEFATITEPMAAGDFGSLGGGFGTMFG